MSFGGGSMISFGFTGTRQGMTAEQKSALRNFLDGGVGEFHHGDCIGADSEAHDIADECGYGIILHPPTNYSERAWREVPRHRRRGASRRHRRREDFGAPICVRQSYPAACL